MAVTLSLRRPKRITLSGTANNTTKVNLPAGARRITIQFPVADGKLALDSSLSDDGAVGAEYLTCFAGQMYELDWSGPELVPASSSDYLFLASATSSAVVEVMAL